MPDCEYNRRIILRDSLMIIPAPLAKIISNVNSACQKEAIPLAQVFTASKAFCDSKGYNEEQFETFVSGKCPTPYELARSYEEMVNWTSIPLRSDFASILRGTSQATESEYLVFEKVWNQLKIKNLLEYFLTYNIADVTLFSDSFVYLIDKLYKLTGIFAIHYLSISSFAVASLLFNSRMPSDRRKRIFLPFLDERHYDLIANNQLTGGFSQNSAVFRQEKY